MEIDYLKSEDRSSCLYERALGAQWSGWTWTDTDGGWRMADGMGWRGGEGGAAAGPVFLCSVFLRSLREEKGCGSVCNRQLVAETPVERCR